MSMPPGQGSDHPERPFDATVPYERHGEGDLGPGGDAGHGAGAAAEHGAGWGAAGEHAVGQPAVYGAGGYEPPASAPSGHAPSGYDAGGSGSSGYDAAAYGHGGYEPAGYEPAGFDPSPSRADAEAAAVFDGAGTPAPQGYPAPVRLDGRHDRAEVPADAPGWAAAGSHAFPGGAGGAGGLPPGRRRFLGLAVGAAGLVVVAAIVIATVFAMNGQRDEASAEGAQWDTIAESGLPEASGEASGGTDGAAATEGATPTSSAASTATTSARPTGSPGASGRPTQSPGASNAAGQAPACRASAVSLRVSGSGSRERTIIAENDGREDCTLEGSPEVAFLTSGGREIEVDVSASSGRAVVLEPGERAEAEVTWRGGSSSGSSQRAAAIEVAIARGQPAEELVASIPITSGASVEVGAWR